MSNSLPEETMTFGELLTLIHQQQQRLQVLEYTLTRLTEQLDPAIQQQLFTSLSQQANSDETDAGLRQQFASLSEALRPDRTSV